MTLTKETRAFRLRPAHQWQYTYTYLHTLNARNSGKFATKCLQNW